MTPPKVDREKLVAWLHSSIRIARPGNPFSEARSGGLALALAVIERGDFDAPAEPMVSVSELRKALANLPHRGEHHGGISDDDDRPPTFFAFRELVTRLESLIARAERQGGTEPKEKP